MDSKLTDLELCKKVAEIEGVKVDEIESFLFLSVSDDELYSKLRQSYSPLNNKALLFDLVIKYEIHLWRGHLAILDEVGRIISRKVYDSVNDIPRAILECIVGANK